MSNQPRLVWVPIAEVEIDPVIQARHRLDLDHVAVLEAAFRRGDPIPPISVVERSGNAGPRYGCYDGAHRLAAARRAGCEIIAALVSEAVPNQSVSAVLNSVRLPLTDIERFAVIEGDLAVATGGLRGDRLTALLNRLLRGQPISAPDQVLGRAIDEVLLRHGLTASTYQRHWGPLRNLDEQLRDDLVAGRLERHHALELGRISNATLRGELRARALAEGWGVRQIRVARMAASRSNASDSLTDPSPAPTTLPHPAAEQPEGVVAQPPSLASATLQLAQAVSDLEAVTDRLRDLAVTDPASVEQIVRAVAALARLVPSGLPPPGWSECPEPECAAPAHNNPRRPHD